MLIHNFHSYSYYKLVIFCTLSIFQVRSSSVICLLTSHKYLHQILTLLHSYQLNPSLWTNKSKNKHLTCISCSYRITLRIISECRTIFFSSLFPQIPPSSSSSSSSICAFFSSILSLLFFVFEGRPSVPSYSFFFSQTSD